MAHAVFAVATTQQHAPRHAPRTQVASSRAHHHFHVFYFQVHVSPASLSSSPRHAVWYVATLGVPHTRRAHRHAHTHIMWPIRLGAARIYTLFFCHGPTLFAFCFHADGHGAALHFTRAGIVLGRDMHTTSLHHAHATLSCTRTPHSAARVAAPAYLVPPPRLLVIPPGLPPCPVPPCLFPVFAACRAPRRAAQHARVHNCNCSGEHVRETPFIFHTN